MISLIAYRFGFSHKELMEFSSDDILFWWKNFEYVNSAINKGSKG